MKNKSTVCTSVLNGDNKEVFGEEGIKDAYRKEFEERLRPREMETGFEKIKTKTETLCKMVLDKCAQTKEDPYTIEELNAVKKGLKKGKATGLDMYPAEIFSEEGQVDNELLPILNEIKTSLKPPSQWNKVGITCLYKNKGSRKDLKNYRGIFLTSVISKIHERLIMGRMKQTITENMSKLQAGGTQNRSTYDQIFLLRSFISHAKYIGKPLYLTLYDFKQCFDNLWLDDAILSLWKLGVNTDLLTMIYKLNEKSTITLKTPLGNTEEFDVPYICKQGTVLIPPMCSASVAECCDEQKRGGATIGSLTLRSLAFMDDLIGMNTVTKDVRDSHDCVTFYSKKKKAPLNEDKCIGMIINSKPPHPHPVLTINNKVMSIVEEAKYLGDMFNSKGDNEALLEDRKKKATRCLVSCWSECYIVTRGYKAIISLILLYKTVYLPTIIFNSEAWDNLTGDDLKMLRVMQMKFLKKILHVPTSTPK